MVLIIFLLSILLLLCLFSFIRNLANENAAKIQEITEREIDDTEQLPLIISLTTSPSRLIPCLQNLERMLRDGSFPPKAEIHLNLPRTFGRTGESYPEISAPDPRIQIYRDSFDDEGPATKLLPTLDRVRQKYYQGLIITIDDDIYYEKEVFELHLYFQKLYNYKVATCFRDLNDPLDITYHFDTYRPGLKELLLPRAAAIKEMKAAPLPHHTTYFIEGFGSVGYPFGLMDPSYLRSYIKGYPKCRNSDDLLISMSLHDQKIPIVKMAVNELYHIYNLIHVLDFGLGEDALHVVQSHHEKYYTCAKEILKS